MLLLKDLNLGQLSIKLAAWVTLTCALLEFIVGHYGNSMALVTDSGYMASDALALFMAMLAIKNNNLRSYMLWFSAIMMLLVVCIMLAQAIVAATDPQNLLGSGVLVVSTIGLLVNIWVSKGLIDMPTDHNLQVAHLHVVCDMLGSAIAVLSGLLAIFGFAPKFDVMLTIISALGVGGATIILMYKMYCNQFLQKI